LSGSRLAQMEERLRKSGVGGVITLYFDSAGELESDMVWGATPGQQERLQRICKRLASHLVEPICRVCGCSEEDACVTGGVPCAWAEENLCTACAEKIGTCRDVTNGGGSTVTTSAFGIDGGNRFAG
jgi:hypothetical protein